MVRLFQSTLPREERPMMFNTPQVVQAFQSTLPREERLLAPTVDTGQFKLSIQRSHDEGATQATGKCNL